MKLYTLNYKTALCATALFVAGTTQAVDTPFMQSMTSKIQATFKDIEGAAKQFETNAKEFKFKKWVADLVVIKNKIPTDIMQPLKDELANPAIADATYVATVQKTLEIITEISKRFERICVILDKHAKLENNDWKDCTKLVKPLKPELLSSIAPATLDALLQKLNDLEALLLAQNSKTVAKDIATLKALVDKLKNGKPTMSDVELFNYISKRLK